MRFGERVGGGLYFGKRQPNWFDRLDAEVAAAVASQVVLAVQHQSLAERAAAPGLRRNARQAPGAGVWRPSGRAGRTVRLRPDHRALAALREVLGAPQRSPTEATVLLTGESGTGKELVARAIHHASRRADGPFVAINCAALADTLLESELFGHERGAFTVPTARSRAASNWPRGHALPGRGRRALGAVQAKLLRSSRSGVPARRGTATLQADVRLIAATNRDLGKEVQAGRFRDDLYYRLNVFTIQLPPLRDRGRTCFSSRTSSCAAWAHAWARQTSASAATPAKPC